MIRGHSVRIVLCIALVCAVFAGIASAVDSVTTTTATGSTAIRAGTILDYTASEVRFRPTGGRDISIPAAQVVRIETARTAAHDEAERLFAARDWRNAADKYAAGIRGEDRAWLRREMFAQMTRCYRELGDGNSAGRVFLQLAKSEATDSQFAAIPLVWQATDKLTTPPAQAREWLEASGSSTANLIGASQLLTSAEAIQAQHVLDRLTRDRDVRIALLAQSQLWRVTQPKLMAAELAARRTTIERLALPLRAGPTFLLAQALAANNSADNADIAIAEFLRVPITTPGDRALAAAGLSEAANLLRKANRGEEAAVLDRELQREYPDAATPK